MILGVRTRRGSALDHVGGLGYRTKGVDIVIPIILPPKRPEEVEDLGPLFGVWPSEKENAVGSRLSYFCIDEKNWASMTASPTKASLHKCRPLPENFEQHVPQNPFLSLIMSFKPKSTTERHVKMFPLTATEISSAKPIQIKMVARDISVETYPFLRDKPDLIDLLRQLLNYTLDPLRGRSDDAATRCMLDSLPFPHRSEQRDLRITELEEEEEWQGIPEE
jgi:hypothetical protein